MNRVERIVYDLVKNNPQLKLRIVRLYQRTCALLPQAALKSEYDVVMRPGFFFGFHDKIPFSADNSRMLAHRNLIGDRTVRPGDKAEVGFFTGDDWKSFIPVQTTTAWDWQLGSMLQWRGVTNEQLVFNDIVQGGIGSRVVTTDGTLVRALPTPVVHVSPDGRLASSYCFRRVAKAMNGYGVRFADDANTPISHFSIDEPGDFKVFSLDTGEVAFGISLEQIREVEPHPSMNGAFHFFHHSLFNPSGTRLFFFHRWVDPDGRLWSRMFCCGSEGSKLFRIPTYEMVSHVSWVDDSTLFAYARTEAGGDGYYYFHDGQLDSESEARQFFNSDGHPMWSPSREAFITDSYPDRFRNQFLYYVDTKRSIATKILRAHLGLKFLDDLQVDIHPRFDRTGTVVCFDSGHMGTRALGTVRLEGLVESV